MADVIRLNHGVLVESFRSDRSVSLRDLIRKLFSIDKAKWEKARKMDAAVYEHRHQTQAYLTRNGFERSIFIN